MSEDDNIAAVMGFSGFGRKEKNARKFNLQEMFETTRRNAHNYSAQVRAKQDTEAQDSAHGVITEGGAGVIGPTPFGEVQVESADEEDEAVGPPLPPGYSSEGGGAAADEGRESDNDDDDEEEDMEEESEEFDKKFPLSHEVVLEHGSKPVSAMGLDPAGARLVTGGYDYEVRLFDFAGMDSSMQAFRSMTPCGSYPIVSLQYSTTGDKLLVAAGSAQAVVMDRDGHKMMECPKGWQYNTDMAHTDGHISMINGACWHPKDKEMFLTCSNDCTLRLWDINNSKKQLHVIKGRDKQGKRSAVTACTFSRDGKFVVGALQDGSIQMWKSSGPYVRSSIQQYTAHERGSETTCLCFAHDNITLISRGGDDTLKLWDVRQFKTPVSAVSGLSNNFPVTDCAFSPDEQTIVTGTSVRKGMGSGQLVFYNRQLQEMHKLAVCDSSVVRCVWHPKLNQIMVGCGDGKARIFFSPTHSQRGAKMCVVKKKRKKLEGVSSGEQQIIAPHALPMFRDERVRSLKRTREKARKDPLASHKPELPILGKGAGGRTVGSGGSSLGAYVRKIAALEQGAVVDEDPREAILKYAKVAKENPYWVSPAYKSTQPKPVLQQEEEEEDDT